MAIGVRSDFLDEGIVLVDTPGVGSTFLHNTVTAEAVLTECERRTARSEAIKVDIEQANRTVVEISDILAELEALTSPTHIPEKREGTQPC